MALAMSDFQSSREEFAALLIGGEDGFEKFQKRFLSTNGSDAEKKVAVDQALKDILHSMVVNDSDTSAFQEITTVATEAVTLELCSASTPFVLLSDIFDGITLDKCAEMFCYVEDRVDTWKSAQFHSAGKNYLLRMCNDLLRRLSKSQNTLFCGRIQLFLARLFPLSEKSGLNLMSQFNLDNYTYFISEGDSGLLSKRQQNENEEVSDAINMEMEDGEADETPNTVTIDYNLYRKFWSLQDYFRRPTQCYDKNPWKKFMDYAGDVLSCFKSYKLDEMKGKKRIEDAQHRAHTHAVFAKYLTSEKLLDLQLSDSNFRRYVLVQFLILFQYLQAQVRFKSSTQVLSEEASTWMKTTLDTVYELLTETPPDGARFTSSIRHILSREENWNSWKNDGCPSYVREREEPTVPKPTRATKRSMGEDLAAGGKTVKMGSIEITRLWNLSRDNMSACRNTQASVPGLEEFFEEAIEQADPEAAVEDAYKLINNENWSWKALRLLSRQSPHFFSPHNQAGKKVGEYLETVITKLHPGERDKTASGSASASPRKFTGQAENSDDKFEKTETCDDDDDEEIQDTQKKSVVTDSNVVSTNQLEQLAVALGKQWKCLAAKMEFPEDDIQYWESCSKDVTQQAMTMLKLWKENAGDKAAPGELIIYLNKAGLNTTAELIFDPQ